MSTSASLLPSPPSYSTGAGLQDREVMDPVLPGYSRRQGLLAPSDSVKFSSTTKTGSGTRLELVLESSSNSVTSLPTYVEGQSVCGRVTLGLPNSQTVREVIVEVKGLLFSSESSFDREPFLNIPFTLWTSSSSTSRRPSSPDSATSSNTTQSQTSKLFGESSWTFSVDLPKEVIAPFGPRKELGIFKLPHSFAERHARVSIAYEVCVRVRRGRFASDYRTSLGFVYIPATQPGPPSLLRQIAYQQNHPIPSPDLDPDGWYSASPFQMKGNIFGKAVSITCTLSLPKPLIYTRGEPIPISLLLDSDDSDALDVISSPRSITARLRRVTKYRTKQDKRFDPQDWRDNTGYSQLASWWDCSESAVTHRRRRRISGELHIHKDTKPTTAIADFKIEYSLVLLPFDDTALRSTSTSSEPLISIPVEIATMHGHGPQPRMYAPPSYESTDTRHIDPHFSDYNMDLGL